jgi:hypothetical protein
MPKERSGMHRTTPTLIIALALLLPMLLLAKPGVVAQDETSLPAWNTSFPTRQELIMPYNTSTPHAANQALDLPVSFHDPCWTTDVTHTSIRVVCWNGTGWTELPSQIYNLQASNITAHIKSANIIFLIPATANGRERYFLYYSPNQTTSPTYTDHLNIVDQTYNFNPIQQIQANAQFYGFIQDGYDIYGIGQEGKILDRACAQVVVKQPNNTTAFDALNADQFVSYAFSYYYGPDEKDESSSDQVFLDKKVLIDGPLMISVQITSQSSLGDVKTTNQYRYYYTPTPDKRLYVHVNHQLNKAATVKGMDNIDGRFGSIISVKARSSTIPALNMGDINPLLDFNATTQPITEYQMDPNPETTDREWIIPYQDNADLGPNAWLSYGDGKTGRANAVIFQSNKGLITTTDTNEHDGIQLKVCEKQYFNFLGTQVDYASLNFGRNSYTPGQPHDLTIPSDLHVQFDALTYYSPTGGYTATQQEARLFQALIRNHTQNTQPPTNTTLANLTINAIFPASFLTWLAQFTSTTSPTVTIDLTHNCTLTATAQANTTILTQTTAHFTNITTGNYLAKVYLKINNNRMIIGAATLTLNTTKTIQLICTFERPVHVTITNQHNHGIANVTIRLQDKNGNTYDHNTTDTTGTLTLRAPYNTTDPYTITATYKGRTITTQTLQPTIQYATATITQPLYNLSVKVVDTLNLPPAITITPTLTTQNNNQTTTIQPDTNDGNRYLFANLFSDNYTAQLLYRNHIDSLPIRIPQDGSTIQLQFTQTYPITIDLYDIRGNPINNPDLRLRVYRNNGQVYTSMKNTVSLPPATYELAFYDQNREIAQKTIELTNEHHTSIVTILDPQLPPVLLAISVAVFAMVAILAVLRKVKINTLLLALALSLVILAIVQPWWELAGSSTKPAYSRHITMFVQPGVLMESFSNQTATLRTISEMPAQFTTFLSAVITALIITGLVAAITVIVSLRHNLRLRIIAESILIALLVSISIIYIYGTSILTDIGIGSLQGSGVLHTNFEGIELSMPSNWGLGSGYYLIILAAITTAGSLTLTVLEWRKKRQS